MKLYENFEDIILKKYFGKNFLTEQSVSIPRTRARSFIERTPYLLYLLRQLIREVERNLPKLKKKIQKREIYRLRVHEKIVRWIRTYIVSRQEFENFNTTEFKILTLIFMLYYLEALSLLISAGARLGKKIKGLIDFGKELFTPRLYFFESKNFSTIDDLYDYCDNIAIRLISLLENNPEWGLYLMESENVDLRLFLESSQKVLLEQGEEEETVGVDVAGEERVETPEEEPDVGVDVGLEPDVGITPTFGTPVTRLEQEEEDIMAYAEKKAKEFLNIKDVVDVYSLLFDKLKIETNYYLQVFSKMAQIFAGEKFYYSLVLKRIFEEFKVYLEEIEENYDNFNSLPDDDKRMMKAIFKILKTTKDIINTKLLKESITIYEGYRLLRERSWRLSYSDWEELIIKEKPEIKKIIDDIKKTKIADELKKLIGVATTKEKVVDLLIKTFNLENPSVKFSDFDKYLFSLPAIGSNVRTFLQIKVQSLKDVYKIIDKVVGDKAKSNILKTAFILSKLNVISKQFMVDISLYINSKILKTIFGGKIKRGFDFIVEDLRTLSSKLKYLNDFINKNKVYLSPEFVEFIDKTINEVSKFSTKNKFLKVILYDYIISFVLILVRFLEENVTEVKVEKIPKSIKKKLNKWNNRFKSFVNNLELEGKTLEQLAKSPGLSEVKPVISFISFLQKNNFNLSLSLYCNGLKKFGLNNFVNDQEKLKSLDTFIGNFKLYTGDKRIKLDDFINFVNEINDECRKSVKKLPKDTEKETLYNILLKSGYSPFPNFLVLGIYKKDSLKLLSQFKTFIDKNSPDKEITDEVYDKLKSLVIEAINNTDKYLSKIDDDITTEIKRIEQGINKIINHKFTMSVIEKLFKKEKDDIILDALYWFDEDEVLDFLKTKSPVGEKSEKELGFIGKMINNAIKNLGFLSSIIIAGPYLAVAGGLTGQSIDNMFDELNRKILSKLGYKETWA